MEKRKDIKRIVFQAKSEVLFVERRLVDKLYGKEKLLLNADELQTVDLLRKKIDGRPNDEVLCKKDMKIFWKVFDLAEKDLPRHKK